MLQAEYPTAVLGLSNWGPAYDDILTNPSKYGFTNVTDPCRDLFNPGTPTCSTPCKYFYYYYVHPSTAAHQVVGDGLYQEALGLPTRVPVPSTWAMVFAGFVAVAPAARRKSGAAFA